jgi:hypothetical protein
MDTDTARLLAVFIVKVGLLRRVLLREEELE